MSYAAIAGRAAQKVAAKGADVLLSGAGALVYNPSTGLWTGTEIAEYTASAVQDEGDPDRLSAANLVLVNPETLLVAARYRGALIPRPVPNMVFTWAGLAYTIRLVDMLAPDGVPITYTVYGSR